MLQSENVIKQNVWMGLFFREDRVKIKPGHST